MQSEKIDAAASPRTGAVALCLMMVVFFCSPGYALTRQTETPIDNPDLVQACGLNVLMVLDESGSIGNNADDVQDAFTAFVDALKNTSSSMAVAEFSKVARLPALGPFSPGEYVTITDATETFFDDYIATYNPGGNTNWEDGLRMGIPNHAPRPDFTVPHLTVFITDGDPTRIIRTDRVTDSEYKNKVPLNDNETTSADKNLAANRAVGNANNLKTQQSHILVVAVGNGVTSSASLSRIQKISGPDVYPNGNSDPFDITTDDVYREPDFNQLEDALREAAFQLCSPSVTIEKRVDLTPDPNSTADAVPGGNWSIAGTVSVPAVPDFAWVLPVSENPAANDTKTTGTDASGFATFQWLPTAAVGASTFTATETVQAGFRNDQTATTCTYRTPDQSDTGLNLSTVGDGTFTAEIPAESIVTCQLLNIAIPAPAISLQKRTNGSDADTVPGPTIASGKPVSWTYDVTNLGNTVLNSVQVTDQVTLPIAASGGTVSVQCPKSILIQGESMQCSATGVAGQLESGGNFTGQYGNEATVTATDSTGINVNATDPSHYLEVEPGVEIQKSTNGQDADSRPGPLIDVGQPVTWEYRVSNTGSEPLSNVVVTDSEGVSVIFQDGDANSNNRLDLNEVWRYTGQGNASSGQYQNIGEVSANGASKTVVDQDPSHYFGVAAAIAIEKSTNGIDADSPPGPTIIVGDPVTWQYEVTNTGNTPLIGWSVSDDQGVSVNCPNIILPPGSSASCFGAGVAQTGQYANVATAIAPDPGGGPNVTATDPSHYLGAAPAITLEKSTNGEDADDPKGPIIATGDPVAWSYVATNTGNVPLGSLLVVDSQLQSGDVTCPPTPVILPTESVTCTANGIAQAGQYQNTALVLAVPSNPLAGPGSAVADIDRSHYFGAAPGIAIEKYTNGLDADLPADAAFIPIGDPVDWVYLVINTGNEPLLNIQVTDDRGAIPLLVSGDDNNNNQLETGETWRFEAIGIAAAGDYANIGTATAADALGLSVTDTDPSHYFGFVNEITVEKSTAGVGVTAQDADLPPGPNLPVNSAVTWTYVVSSSATASPISNLRLTDDQLGEITTPPAGDTGNDGILSPGEIWTYTVTGTTVAGQYANLAEISGVGVDNVEVSDVDPSHYFGGDSSPALTLEKYTNGQDADTPPGPLLSIGTVANFVYVLENTGDVPLLNVAVADDQGVNVDCQGGNPVPRIAAGAQVICNGQATVSSGQYANLGSATGVDDFGDPVAASDPSHHFGVLPFNPGVDEPGISIEKSTNTVDADNPSGPKLLVGDTANFIYEVSNTGTTVLADISVVDDQGVTVSCPGGSPIPILQPGETQTCTGDVTVIEGQYKNIGLATGRATDGNTYSDEDPSHHRGVLTLTGVPILSGYLLLLLCICLGGIGAIAMRRR
jgi:uncharacterized repeat protein (TIGR01451 family)